MNAAEVEVGQELVRPVGEQFVEGIARRVAAADEHVHPRLLPRAEDGIPHAPVELAVAEHVGAPAADAQALPRLVPEHEAGDWALRPAVLARDVEDKLLVVVIPFRQPGEVLLAALHDALLVQVRSSAAEGLLLVGCADLHDAGDAVLVHRAELVIQPLEVLRVARRVRREVGHAIADGLNAQPSQNLRRHLLEGLLRVLDPLVPRPEGADVAGHVPPTVVAEVENQGIPALRLGGRRLDGQVPPAACLHIDLEGYAAQVLQSHQLRPPLVPLVGVHGVADDVDSRGLA